MDNIKIEILRKSASERYLGQKVTFEDQETAEIKNRVKAAWAALHKKRQELTSKNTACVTDCACSTDHADVDLCRRNMDIVSDTREDDQDDTTKDASPHSPNEETLQKEEGKGNRREVRERSRKNKKTTTLLVRPMRKTGEGSEQNSNKDQNINVSFQEDEDEEIDKCEKKSG